MRLALAALALVPVSSALRLPATRLPTTRLSSRRSGRPVAQVSSDGDAKDAASTTGFGVPKDLEAEAALSRGQQALEQVRAKAEAQAGAIIPKPVLRWDERARASVWQKLQPWVPNLDVLRRDLKPALKGFGFTQKEKARAYLQQRPPFPGSAAPFLALRQTSDRRTPPALPRGRAPDAPKPQRNASLPSPTGYHRVPPHMVTRLRPCVPRL